MDNRSFLSAASSIPPTPPSTSSTGYPIDGKPATGQPATIIGAYWFYQLGEEIRSIITAADITPSTSTLNQLLSAIQVLFAPRSDAITNTIVYGGIDTYTPIKNRFIISGVGGGGGGGGGLAGGTPVSGYAGAGGSSGSGLLSFRLVCTPGTILTITCGLGGNGGAIGEPGQDGVATTIAGLPSQPGVVDGVFTIGGGFGGNQGNSTLGYALGGPLAVYSGYLTDLGSPGGPAYGYQPGPGGGTCLSPPSFPIIGNYPGGGPGNNGNSRGSGGAGGAPGYAGQNGGTGILIIEE